MDTKSLTEDKKHQYCLSAIGIKHKVEYGFVQLGAMLSKIKNERYYEAGWSSWEEYTMELKISPATASRIIRIYEIFVLKYDIKPKQIAEAGGYTVVAEYLPLLTDKTTKHEVMHWMSNAVELPRADLRRNITEAKKGVDMTKCKHKNTYKLEICEDCGDRWKI